MPKADSVHSTLPTNTSVHSDNQSTSSRRNDDTETKVAGALANIIAVAAQAMIGVQA
jgi:hypothetical protein